jgi:hypothetical protein
MNVRKIVVGAVLIALAAAAAGQQQEEEKVEPKFVWGVLIQLAVSKLGSSAFDAFGKWLVGKFTGGFGKTVEYPSNSFSHNTGAKIAERDTARAMPVSTGSGGTTNVVAGDPNVPLKVEGGQANYQGLHVAIMVAVDGGKRFVFRPVNEGFKSGERFKLRLVSTFGGELFLENINPRGVRKQIYPPREKEIVMLEPNLETFLPLDQNQYFEFAESAGREQLVINFADPRAISMSASPHKVYRQDTEYGSNFVQEVAPGTYPYILQSVELRHSSVN